MTWFRHHNGWETWKVIETHIENIFKVKNNFSLWPQRTTCSLLYELLCIYTYTYMQKQKWDETEVVLQPFFYSTKYSKAPSVSIIFNQFPIIFGSRTNFPNRSTLYETHKVEAFEVGAGMWDPGTTHSGFHWVSFFFTLHPVAPETISRNLVDPINSLDGCAIIYLTNLHLDYV